MRALRPGALPSDTAVRFLLVLSAVTAASLYIFGSLWFLVRGQVFAEAAVRCAGSGGQPIPGLAGTTATQLQFEADCRAAASVEQALVQVGGSVLVLLAGWLAYRAWPRVREGRARLVEPDPVDAAALTGEVAALAGAAGIDPVPQLRLDAADPRVAGFAYGAGGQARLGMTGGLVVSQILDPPGFRAIVRHELGHVANRDVAWTYYAISVWWAFLCLAVAPVVVLFAVRDLDYLLRLGWRTAVLAMLVATTVAALVRVREAYADARAADWGSSEALGRLLAGAPEPRSRRPPALRTHPSPASRLSLLADPDGLFKCSAWALFATGLSGGVAFASLSDLAYLISYRWGVGIAALLVSPMLAAVVCVSAWRVGLREAVRGEELPAVLPIGGGLGVGLAIAPLLSLNAAVGQFGTGVAGWLGYACWATVMVGLSLLVARWAVDCARLRVRAQLGMASGAGRALLEHITVMSALLMLWLSTSAQAFTVLTLVGPVAMADITLWAQLPESAFGLGSGVLLLAAFALLLVQPVRAWQMAGRPWATWFWRTPEASDTGRIGQTAQDPSEPDQQALEPDSGAWHELPRLQTLVAAGVGAGLVGGLAGVGALVVGLGLDAQLRASAVFDVGLAAAVRTGIIAAGVCAGGIAAALVPRRWWPLGLLATLVGVTVAGFLAWFTLSAYLYGFLAAGSVPDHPLGWAETRSIILNPALRSLVPAALVMAVVGSVRGLRRERREPTRRATSPLVRTASAGAGAAIAAGAWVVLPVLTVLGLSLPTVTLPGFELVVPVGWTSAVDQTAGAAQFTTVAQDLRVVILPWSAPPGESRGEVVMVGSRQATLVDAQDDGTVRVLTYSVDGGPEERFRVVVAGQRAALADRGEDVRQLLDAVRWRSGALVGR